LHRSSLITNTLSNIGENSRKKGINKTKHLKKYEIIHITTKISG